MAAGQIVEIPALIVHQWLDEWDEVVFTEQARRRKPDPYFYLFAIEAEALRRLSNIYRHCLAGWQQHRAG
jgi:hypothetical protein